MTDFDQFWAAYPRKVGKGAARTAFRAALKKTTLDVMLMALVGQVFQPQWQDGRFIPHPATWLRQERWLDEYTVTAADLKRGLGIDIAIAALDQDIAVARRRDDLLRQGKSRSEVSAILEAEAEG